jgi:hypothetical protein
MSELELTFPDLTEFMDKSLYQEAADSMVEAIALYAINGSDIIGAVLFDIRRLLSSNISDQELSLYIDRHSDYSDPEGARATLKLILTVLASKQV